MALIPFFELVRIPVQFYKIMGQDILERAKKDRLQRQILALLLYGGLINYTILYILQGVYLGLALNSGNYLEAYATAPAVGFGIVALFKIMTLHMNMLSIREILRELEEMFPKSLEFQKNYNLAASFRTLKPVMKLYAGLCLINTFYFVVFPIAKSIIAMILTEIPYDFPLPLYIWYPYDTKKNWFVYLATFLLQAYGALQTAVAYLSADLFLVSCVQQLCIHFNYISLELGKFKPSSDEINHQFLRRIIKLHIKCLELSNSVDTIFGLSLLLNFVASSATICFVGFQVTSATVEELLQYIVMLVTTTSQVFIICFYGNKLIETSEAVGEAAFGHPWYMCNLAYRKMVVLVIARSQKFAAIHAPTFPPISLETFMKVISMSYQFFAVIQTTSDK